MDNVVVTIKEKLHQYIDTLDERKLQAFYIMLEDEIEQDVEYTEEFKKQLDSRFAQYQLDGLVIEESEANLRIDNLLDRH